MMKEIVLKRDKTLYNGGMATIRDKGYVEEKMHTLGSLFDGIGGWPLAAVRNGIKPVWASEIEPFPIQVTKRHFPEMIQLGDITQIDGAKIQPVDIICMGSPCQDFIISGIARALNEKE